MYESAGGTRAGSPMNGPLSVLHADDDRALGEMVEPFLERDETP